MTVVIATVLTALAANLTMSAKNTTQSKQRSSALGYAQEGLEVFRRERHNLGWIKFYEALNSGTYCLNTLPVDSAAFVALTTGQCADGTVIGTTNLQREASVNLGADEARVELTVTWFDGAEEKTVNLTQNFQDI